MSQTWQDHFKRILKVLVYIQGHLDDDMNLELLSGIAHISPYHFHRLFRAHIGESLHQYIRRLRLEKAAGKLIHSGERVTDIGLDAGFDTPSSFNRRLSSYGHLSQRIS